MKKLNKKAKAVMDVLTQGMTRPGDHEKFDSEAGYMAVHVDRLGDWNGYPCFAVAHNYIQEGDVMADPDMTFYLVHSEYYPATYQLSGMGIYQQSLWFEGTQLKLKPKMQKDHAVFAGQWMINIKDQQALEC